MRPDADLAGLPMSPIAEKMTVKSAKEYIEHASRFAHLRCI
jgi:hypothetical protein